ncbi:MAG TPA: crossover junction endodeoxyribonuclease RuvC [Patescibacteria group bacterium]|nr:crossover junction endodeoxyribonuclease RuvC [Patescibacteria group bacterium]
MIILGIDPGTTTTGFGLVRLEKHCYKLLDYGVIATKPKIPLPEKLIEIYQDISQIIQETSPDLVAVEKLFFLNNAKTAMAVGQARGVVLLAAAKAKKEILEFTPLEVKLSVCGHGRADKVQVQNMVKAILKLDFLPKPDDAADALAVAICGHNNCKY